MEQKVIVVVLCYIQSNAKVEIKYYTEENESRSRYGNQVTVAVLCCVQKSGIYKSKIKE